MLRGDGVTINPRGKKVIYPIIEGWDINRILSLAPRIDSPIPVLYFEGIPCSVYGSPLILNDGKYIETEHRGYKKKQNETFRIKGRIVKVNNKNNKTGTGRKGNRYLIVLDKNGIFKPIMEVTDGGRSVRRCKQWAKILKYAYDEKLDEIILDTFEYKEHLKELKNNLIV